MERTMVHDTKKAQTISPLAGKPAPRSSLVDLARLEREYYERKPDLSDPAQRVSFGTSGRRGSSLRGSFTEEHIAAITQAICEYRRAHGIDGPLHIGRDVKARFAIEQASTFGWERYVGETGQVIGMETFGASAPLKELQKKFGFHPERVVAAAKTLLGKA
jgi:Phosphoglucomutase/phosphomannomutase, alpha/beta/alpha domain I